jgi:uncharacterized protein (DUF934 family)
MTLIAMNPAFPADFARFDAKNAAKRPAWTPENTEVPQAGGEWQNAERIELNFPKFTDGRAFSQAALLRRLGYGGDIRAVGDVLVDQVQQMQRCGFSSAVLRADQNPAAAKRLAALFAGFYQGDAVQAKPLFARAEEAAA